MKNHVSLLPTVDFCGRRVTRLIVGGNPFRGYSHLSPQLDREMTEYYTRENTVRALLDCERQGINTMLSRGDAVIFEAVRVCRAAGGTMHWIAQTASEQRSHRYAAAAGPRRIERRSLERDSECDRVGQPPAPAARLHRL